MPDTETKRISELIAAQDIGDSDLFVIEQGGAAKKALGSVVKGAIGGLPSGGNNGQVLTKTSNGAAWSDAGTPTQAQTDSAVADWLDAHPEATTTVQDGSITEQKLDPYLTAKVNGGGISNAVKVALLTLLEKVAYIDDQGQTYLDALETALYPPASLVSITAVFNQGSATIYDTDTLDDLKQYLTVTANYDDDTSATVTDYTLSGELVEGTSTITVTRGSLRATFNVTVTANPLPEGYTLYDYLTADGTQYIQTNITEAQAVDWGYECKESANGTAQGNGHILSSTNVYFPFLGRGDTSTALWNFYKRYGNESATTISGTQRYEAGTPYTFKAFLDGTDYINRLGANGEIDYTGVLTKGSAGLTSSNKFALFAYGGGVTTAKYRFRGNFYYLKLTDANGNLVHHYIPCRNANNVIGLYDVVAESFLSPTAGTFTGKAR